MKYRLQIFEPGEPEDPMLSLESDEPFLAIGKGDLINLRAFDKNARQTLARVVNVEHYINVMDDELKCHQICVFTHGEEDTPETRVS